MTLGALLLGAVWLAEAAAAPPGGLQAPVLHTFQDNTDGISLHFDFSADGQRFLLWGGKALQLHDTKSGKEIARFVHPKIRSVEKFDFQPGWPYLAKLLPDGHTVAASFFGGSSDMYLLDLP